MPPKNPPAPRPKKYKPLTVGEVGKAAKESIDRILHGGTDQTDEKFVKSEKRRD